MKGQFGKCIIGLGDLAGDELRGKEIERAARRKKGLHTRGVVQKVNLLQWRKTRQILFASATIDSGTES